MFSVRFLRSESKNFKNLLELPAYLLFSKPMFPLFLQLTERKSLDPNGSYVSTSQTKIRQICLTCSQTLDVQHYSFKIGLSDMWPDIRCPTLFFPIFSLVTDTKIPQKSFFIFSQVHPSGFQDQFSRKNGITFKPQDFRSCDAVDQGLPRP